MAVSSSKKFSFKKKTPEVFFDDEDDDDFKPTKYSQSQPASSISNTVKSNPVTVTSVTKDPKKSTKPKKEAKVVKKRIPEPVEPVLKPKTEFESKLDESVVVIESDDDDLTDALLVEALEEIERVHDVCSGKSTVSGEGIDHNDVILLDEPENSDLFGSQPGSSNGKDAWKSLMSQMQKNQKDGCNKGTKNAIRAASKRGLPRSPNSKGLGRGHVPSPARKTARNGAGLGSDMKVNVLQEFKNGTEIDFTKEIKAGASQGLISELTQPIEEKKVPLNVAPIFLPPSERKELQKTLMSQSDTQSLLESIVESNAQFCDSNHAQDDPRHFTGNRVILNPYQPEKDPYDGLKTKKCPFYKILPGVPFCVDAFNYGLVPGMEVYFLSHFHSDHYIGLTKKFCKTIICSHPTGNLVRMRLYVEDSCIRKLRMNTPYIVCDTEVVLIDANHCPGSVMFIFRFKNGKVTLHTGDFRYTPDMLENKYLSAHKVDTIYLDTTYCSPEYDFPTQNESIASVVAHVKRHLEFRPQTLILCGSYLIGKERVYFTLAEAIGSKVFGQYDKRRNIKALENRKFTSLLTDDDKIAKVHVITMAHINPKSLKDYLEKYSQYTNIIGIKPSGWQFSSCGTGVSVKTSYNGSVTLLGVPYSEHSSFSELKECVTRLKPYRVQPTVNVGSAKKREEMMKHIDAWLAS